MPDVPELHLQVNCWHEVSPDGTEFRVCVAISGLPSERNSHAVGDWLKELLMANIEDMPVEEIIEDKEARTQ